MKNYPISHFIRFLAEKATGIPGSKGRKSTRHFH